MKKPKPQVRGNDEATGLWRAAFAAGELQPEKDIPPCPCVQPSAHLELQPHQEIPSGISPPKMQYFALHHHAGFIAFFPIISAIPNAHFIVPRKTTQTEIIL